MIDVFVSVGTGLSAEQEAFVSAVEARLRALGCSPCTIGRNTFSADAPLRAITNQMDKCSGVVVIAVERYWIGDGFERRGSDAQKAVKDAGLATPWNQIEAALAYNRNLPLLVLVDQNVRCDGLLEKGNDWFVHQLPINPNSLNTPTFAGLLDNWRQRLSTSPRPSETVPDLGTVSLYAFIRSLRLSHVWAALGALAILLGGAFTAGMWMQKLMPPQEPPHVTSSASVSPSSEQKKE
ncbi:hypothetical protein [Brevundimonas sp. GCM10030266]|uniref:hypothetical protein n=1 Tax=Brevundimonas sp. GCM10030266 TaxID=3273386 RepID=UPI00361F546C